MKGEEKSGGTIPRIRLEGVCNHREPEAAVEAGG